ncbi:hypothetical protein MTP10_37440 [Nonomuraea sp. 3-1Str]|uniref:hypothetical protein n=1 Tax=Nonomuraea sp. 3-1Str TaxID=2929801 RepID=UPI002860CA23|nr:hypothetical protein [Nonomuraea sp. 3-1Str]MDR8414399.1 hypothetical protein [Nonomuraea sp. 3-1Str]
MRGRVPAVLLLLMSVFVFAGPGAHGDADRNAHQHVLQSAWWSAPGIAGHAGLGDPAPPDLHPARATPVLPVWLAVAPPVWQPGQATRRASFTATRPPAPPRPGHRVAGARAPPSTTR